MATKLQFLAVAVVACSAAAMTINDRKPALGDPALGDTAVDHVTMSRKAQMEEKIGLQEAMMEEKPLLRKKYKRSAEFEKDIGELIMSLSKSGQGGTPMAASVREIARIIREDMLDAVMTAHSTDQDTLVSMADAITDCDTSRVGSLAAAASFTAIYEEKSGLHKTCRAAEAALFSEHATCIADQRAKKEVKELNCHTYSEVSKSVSDQQKVIEVVERGQDESVAQYVERMTRVLCGTEGVPADHGGAMDHGYLDQLLDAKEDCEVATELYNAKKTECTNTGDSLRTKRDSCDALQKAMDDNSCQAAVDSKDACESYSECYTIKKQQDFDAEVTRVTVEESDRKQEWKGLKKMECLITAFDDGKVEDSEIDSCKDKFETTDTDHLTIEWPGAPDRVPCEPSDLYPTTAAYKIQEYEPLPTNAKGQLDANECTGLKEINTDPNPAYKPDGCTCTRVTITGTFAPGALVKCLNCERIESAGQPNSCPVGTKLFAPTSEVDWDSFLKSVNPDDVRAPNFIVDVTRPLGGCYHCGNNAPAMNSVDDGNSPASQRWRTSDGAAWWLRSDSFQYPAGDYTANCYMNIESAGSANDVSFQDGGCSYNSKSYFCQPEYFPTTPKEGSPEACQCTMVELDGTYSPGKLIKCERCLDVSKSEEKNSCPYGTKIFSPRTKADWVTFLASAQPLRAPNWIIDITRDEDGCGGCLGPEREEGDAWDHSYDMNSGAANQATWKTSDGSAWWLRDTEYTQPNGDGTGEGIALKELYGANCYLDLWQNPASADTITFDDTACHAHSRSYYCQPVSTTTTTTDGEAVQAAAAASSSSSGSGVQCSGSQCSGGGYSLFTDTGRCSGWKTPPDGNQGYQGRYEDCFQHCNEDPDCIYVSTYDDGKTCVHSNEGGCDSFFTSCWGGCRAFKKGAAVQGYALQSVSSVCASGKRIESRSECLTAHATLGSDALVYEAEVDVPTNPQGCFVNTGSNTLYFNTASDGPATTFIRPMCKT